ncbi:hypothetical protein [Nocardioides sp. SYSU D00065]|uniref:hypothetical protein n=1 Tax=Nocardioides sp. SYSU D00065 TaxID=2817378 RepID=UPI001B333FF7|nr:hypothetical protein [Nocardioides sp. SYSU D00065]
MSSDQLAQAVDTSRAWYTDIHALHGIPTLERDGLWRALGPALPWHSAVKTLRPDVDVAAVMAVLSDAAGGTVADSYGSLDLCGHGYSVLLEAQWLRLAPETAVQTRPSRYLRWAPISTSDELAVWSRAHDYADVLVPGILEQPRFTVLGCYAGAELVGGAVLHDAGSAMGLSNVWWTERRGLQLHEVVEHARRQRPGRAICGYASSDQATVWTDVGFVPLGPHRVWTREAD